MPAFLNLTISTEDWHKFEQMIDDNSDTHLVWRGPACSGQREALVVCTGRDVAGRLEDGWA